MTDETPNPAAPEPDPTAAGGGVEPTSRRATTSADVRPHRPDYRGEELDPERGPGLGCFWFQVIVLGFFIVIIPVGLNLGWPYEVLAILLFVVIGLLLLTGQTVIFLLRLVAADRRAQGRRRPLASPTKTVGELEDEQPGGRPSRPARATARPEGPVEPVATAVEPPAPEETSPAAEPAAGGSAPEPEPPSDQVLPVDPEPPTDQVLPVDPESVIRAQRVDSSGSASPREPAAGDDGAVPSVAGAAASVAAEALGEGSFEEGTSDALPPVSPQDSSTASRQTALEAAPDRAPDGSPAESDAPEPPEAAASSVDPEEPDPGVRQ